MVYDQSVMQTKTAKYLIKVIKLLLSKTTRDEPSTRKLAKQAIETFDRADKILMGAMKGRRRSNKYEGSR